MSRTFANIPRSAATVGRSVAAADVCQHQRTTANDAAPSASVRGETFEANLKHSTSN